MRSKDILSIVVFITAFVFSSAFASLFIDKSQTNSGFSTFEIRNAPCRADVDAKTAIEELLYQDIRNGRERLWRMDDYSNSSANSYYSRYAVSVEKYAGDSGSMSYGHLPRDFQIKWRQHMRAWRDYANFLNKTKHSSHEFADSDFYRSSDEHIFDINSTWYDVLRVGRKYCAVVSE